MGLPPNWKTSSKSSGSPENAKDGEDPQGHQQTGGTICLHSLAVSKQYQKMGLGSVLMKSYIQRIKDAKIAERIALLAHDHLVKFYEGLGFENMGESNVTSCGGGWNNMVSDSVGGVLGQQRQSADVQYRFLSLRMMMTTRRRVFQY
jgi:hypothetical protein